MFVRLKNLNAKDTQNFMNALKLYEFITAHKYICPNCERYLPDFRKWKFISNGSAWCKDCIHVNPEVAGAPPATQEKREVAPEVTEPGFYVEPQTQGIKYKRCVFQASLVNTNTTANTASSAELRYYMPSGEFTTRTKRGFPSTQEEFETQQKEMWEHVTTLLPRIEKLASKISATSGFTLETTEIYDVCISAACRAAQRYSPSSGDLWPFAHLLIRRAIGKHLRDKRNEESPYSGCIDIESVGGELTKDKFSSATLNALNDIDTSLDGLTLDKLLYTIGFTEHERYVAMEAWGKKRTYEDIGREFGVIKQTVGAWMNKIKQKIRYALDCRVITPDAVTAITKIWEEDANS